MTLRPSWRRRLAKLWRNAYGVAGGAPATVRARSKARRRHDWYAASVHGSPRWLGNTSASSAGLPLSGRNYHVAELDDRRFARIVRHVVPDLLSDRADRLLVGLDGIEAQMAQHCELRLRAGSTAAEPLLHDATFQRAPEHALQHRDVRREVVIHVELRAVSA